MFFTWLKNTAPMDIRLATVSGSTLTIGIAVASNVKGDVIRKMSDAVTACLFDALDKLKIKPKTVGTTPEPGPLLEQKQCLAKAADWFHQCTKKSEECWENSKAEVLSCKEYAERAEAAALLAKKSSDELKQLFVSYSPYGKWRFPILANGGAEAKSKSE